MNNKQIKQLLINLLYIPSISLTTAYGIVWYYSVCDIGINNSANLLSILPTLVMLLLIGYSTYWGLYKYLNTRKRRNPIIIPLAVVLLLMSFIYTLRARVPSGYPNPYNCSAVIPNPSDHPANGSGR